MSHKLWDDLARIALLGTGRAPMPAINGSETPLTPLLKQITGEPPERALLQASAILYQYRRCGGMASMPPLPQPNSAPTEQRPPAPLAAERYLKQIIHGKFNAIAPEWLQLTINRQERLPPQFLPHLLDFGIKRAGLHTQITQILGQRGNWLAAQNPKWHYALDIAYLSKGERMRLLRDADRAARHNIFSQLRRSQPRKARNWLESVWKNEPATSRNKFIQLMSDGLSLADEPFLERCLDERGHTIRTNAINLLAKMPASSYSNRMVARALPIFDFANDQIKFDQLDEPPEQLKRDGVIIRPTDKNKPDNWRVSQMIHRIPLQRWSDHWSMTPAELGELTIKSKIARVIFRGWAKAAISQQNQEWAEMLLYTAKAHWLNNFQEKLMAVLPPSRREAFAQHVMDQPRKMQIFQSSHPALVAFVACRHPWSDDFARNAIGYISQKMKHDRRNFMPGTVIRDRVAGLALHCPPCLAAELNELMEIDEGSGTGWQRLSRDFINTLTFRADMRHAFDTAPTEGKS